MSEIIGNQFIYNGKGYLDGKMQPVETPADLGVGIETRQLFQGLTVTVIHPDGNESKPVDYVLWKNQEGRLEWTRKDDGTHTTVETQTPDYIEVTRSGRTFYVNKGAWFDRFESGITESLEEIYSLIDELSSGITEDLVEINERIDREVSALTETISGEVERIDAKDAQQDELIAGIYDWRIEKTESGNTDYYALIDGSGNTLGDVIEVTNEQYLENVEYISAATEQDKEIDDSVVIGDPYLKFTWAYDIITYVAVKTLVNDYFAGDGIEITPGHEVSVKLSGVDSGATCYLSTNDSGLELNMFYEVDE